MLHKKLARFIQGGGTAQSFISKKTGISQSRLTRIFRSEKCYMRADEYILICDALSIPYDFFKSSA